MRHGHVSPEILSATVDGAATPAEAAMVRAHLDTCPACRDTVSAFRQTKALLAAASRRPMPRDLRERLEKRFIPVSWRERFMAFITRPRVWAPVGALAAAAAAFFFLAPSPEPVSLEVLMASHARYQGETLAPRADLYHSYFTAHVARELDDE